MSLASGMQLGPYTVGARLGAGGMGEVWRASDARLGRDVALKVLPAALTADADALTRFEREARLLASLNHPHVATIYGVEEAGGMRALVMELVEGPTLAERLAEADGPLPLEETLAIARQIAEALEHAHEKGIVHRDLKPQNVKLAADGQVKVLDFGLAKALDPRTTSGGAAGATATEMARSPTLSLGATVQGVILGTAAYMAPEQARGMPVDRRADIWSFGVVLWEMVTGHRLFEGELVTDVLAGVLRQDVDFAALPTSTPPAIRRVLTRCLVRSPKNRLRDIGDVRLELADPAETAPVAAASAPPSSGVAAATPPPASPHRRRIAGAAVVLALLGAGGLAGWLLATRARRGATADAGGEAPLVRFAVSAPSHHLLNAYDGPVAVSRDGRHLVFLATATTADAEDALWVRDLASGEEGPLAGSGDAYEPFWSPDGRSVGAFSRSSLVRWDVGGEAVGAAFAGAEGSAGAAVGGKAFPLAPVVDGRGGSWSPRGVIVFAPSPTGPLLRVAVDGGRVEPVTRLDASRGEVAHQRPWFLPDGVHFLYWAESANPADSSLAVGSLDRPGGAVARVPGIPGPARCAPSGDLVFVRGARLFAQRFDTDRLALAGEPQPLADEVLAMEGYRNFAAGIGGDVLAFQTVEQAGIPTWVDRAGTSLGTVGAIGDRNLDLSPDGTRVAVNARDPRGTGSDLWVVDLGRDVRTRLTFGPDFAVGPVWSRDGTRIYYVARTSADTATPRVARGREARLMVQAATGVGTPREILASSELGEPVAMFPDDRRLIVETHPEGHQTDLEIVDVASGTRTPFAATPASEESGRVSPDGRFLVYVSRESGRGEVFLQPYPPTGDRWQVSTRGGDSPRWQANGHEIVYVAPGRQLTAVSFEASPKVAIGSPVALARIGGADWTTTSRPDRFLVVAPPIAAEPSPIQVVLGWRRLLAQRQQATRP